MVSMGKPCMYREIIVETVCNGIIVVASERSFTVG